MTRHNVKPVDTTGVLEKLGAPEDLRQLCQASAAKALQAGARVKAARESLGMPQLAFAEVAGLSRRGLQDLEAQKNVPSGATLAAMQGLGVSADWVLSGRGSPQLPKSSDLEDSQALRISFVKMASQLLREVLDEADADLTPAQAGEATVLLAQLLEKGLPEADVRPLARRTVGMISTGGGNGGKATTGR